MSVTVHFEHDIPHAPAFVVAKDTFLSGWGPARGKTNWTVCPCDSAAQAERTLSYAKSRSDTKSVAIVDREHVVGLMMKPTNLLSLMSPTDAKAWYPKE